MAIQLADKDNFKELIAEDFVVVDFFSTTCGPCKVFSKVLEDIEAEIPFLNIVKINITDNPEVAEEYSVRAVPTIHFYQGGELVDSHVGVLRGQEVKEIVSRYLYA